jgi:hypothetical protein
VACHSLERRKDARRKERREGRNEVHADGFQLGSDLKFFTLVFKVFIIRFNVIVCNISSRRFLGGCVGI